jgi:uncharacterized membrane protein YgaE (UPF0421/DUF939 family)
MEKAGSSVVTRLNRDWLTHSLRTMVAAVAALYIARLVRLPEAYWATITAIVVMQSTLGAALQPSRQRFIGTALGVVAGAVAASYFGRNAIAFAAGLFLLGMICATLSLDRSAYRFAGMALAIVALPAHGEAPWIAALHRFVEVSIGIGVGLAVTALWPEPEVSPAAVKASEKEVPGSANP